MHSLEQPGTSSPENASPKPHQNDVHHFRLEGRRYRLCKRTADRSSPWYTDFSIAGLRYHRSLDTNIQAAAEERAKAIIRAAKAEKWAALDSTKLKRTSARLSEVLEVYTAHAAGHIKEHTLNNYIGCLRNVLAVALALPTEPRQAFLNATDALSTACLTPQLVRKFRENFLATRLAGLDGDKLERARRLAWLSGNSLLQQARSVFSKGALLAYEDSDLRLPDTLTAFRAEPGFKKLNADYMPASDVVVQKTFAAIHEVQNDPNLVRAFWLANGAGLRKSEISKARWDHLTLRNGLPWFDSDIPGKDGKPIQVPFLSFAFEALAKLRPPEGGPILTGHATETGEHVFRRIGVWMTQLGWTSKKKTHELRAWAGSKIIDTHGLEAASQWMRHKEQSTTQRKYGRYVKIKGLDINLPSALTSNPPV